MSSYASKIASLADKAVALTDTLALARHQWVQVVSTGKDTRGSDSLEMALQDSLMNLAVAAARAFDSVIPPPSLATDHLELGRVLGLDLGVADAGRRVVTAIWHCASDSLASRGCPLTDQLAAAAAMEWGAQNHEHLRRGYLEKRHQLAVHLLASGVLLPELQERRSGSTVTPPPQT